jgi:cytochrome P450
MTDYTELDYFRDREVALDPFEYYEFLHKDRPIWIEPKYGVALVSGWQEAFDVLRQPEIFSSCNIVAGPKPEFSEPLPTQTDDITEFIDVHRDELPQSDQIVTFDPPKHTAHRSLIMGLITPKRLKENEDFMWRLADRQLDEILSKGTVEFIEEFCQPYTLLVIADLMGVPEGDHEHLLQLVGIGELPGGLANAQNAHHSLEPLYEYFMENIAKRRENPTGDVLSGMAVAKFPDGSTPELVDLARIASNMFAAGQETTVRLLGACLQILGDNPEYIDQLRQDRDLIPRFIEEALRYEGPIKGGHRLTLKTTTIGDVELPAGTNVLVMNGAAGRDPKQFENPDEFQIERGNARRHLAFGHGAHTCPGAPLARSEVRVFIERLLDRTSAITISEEHHGPVGARNYKYMPTYMFRGVMNLYVDFTPVEA